MPARIVPPLRSELLLNGGVPSNRYINYFEQLSLITNVHVEDIAINTANILLNHNHISDNVADIITNTTNITTNATNIATNVTNIATNTTDITTINNELGDLIVVTANYTTSKTARILCNAAITVTLNPTPDDDEKVFVKRVAGAVTVDGNGNNIDGAATLDLTVQYMTYLLCYSSTLSAWFIL